MFKKPTINVKSIKKISLVYTLQVFAVILIFGYTGKSSVTDTKESAIQLVLPVSMYKDTASTGAVNSIWKISTGIYK